MVFSKTKIPLVEQFITQIQNYPSIWDKGSHAYRDTYAKANAWTIILNNLRAMFKEEFLIKHGMNSFENLRKQWKSLKDEYRREKKKLLAPSGSGADAVQKISWPFYNQMAFHEDDKADVGDHAKTSSHIQVLDVDIPIVNWDVDSDQEVTSAAEPGCTISDDQEAAKAHEQPSNIGVESSDLQDPLDPEDNENPSSIRIGRNLPVQREEKQVAKPKNTPSKKRKNLSNDACDEAFERACQSISERRAPLQAPDEMATYANFFVQRLKEMTPSLKKKCLDVMMQVAVNPEEFIKRFMSHGAEQLSVSSGQSTSQLHTVSAQQPWSGFLPTQPLPKCTTSPSLS